MSTTPLRRYTDIPALVSLLTERQITLLNPQTWDDRNDAQYIATYQAKKKLASVLALCFSQANETYHHWRVFANGAAGACIRFDRSPLLTAVKRKASVRTGSVTYLTLKQMRTSPPRLNRLPFLKRVAFQDEREYRIIHDSATPLASLSIGIPLSSIQRVILSPWLHKNLCADMKALLRSIHGCHKLDIVRSTLVSNQEWQNHGASAR